jgi:hypothetical protein
MKTITLYIMIALLIGCATQPAPVEQIKFLTRDRVERFMVKGKTTKAQVIAEFGWPSTTTVSSSDQPGVPYEILTYTKVYFTATAVLMVYINRAGVVTNYIFSGSGALTQ